MNDDIDPTPIDLSALDPTRDQARFDEAVSSIVRDSMRGVASPHSKSPFDADDAFDRLARWWPATLAAAALIIAVSIPQLTSSKTPQTPASAMDVLGIPRALTNVLQSRDMPSLADLTDALMTNQAQ